MLSLAAFAPIETLAQTTTYILLGIFIVVNAARIVRKRGGPGPAGAPDIPRIVPYAGIGISASLFFA